MMRPLLLLLAAATLIAAGCENPNAIPTHTAVEQKIIDQQNKMTPQQRIDQINSSPMPDAAKAVMIKKIKDKYGLQ